LLHRDGDRPAIDDGDIYEKWYKNGVLHRDGELPAVLSKRNIFSEWWTNGQLIRRVGPLQSYYRNQLFTSADDYRLREMQI
jgi:hypothetical protein